MYNQKFAVCKIIVVFLFCLGFLCTLMLHLFNQKYYYKFYYLLLLLFNCFPHNSQLHVYSSQFWEKKLRIVREKVTPTSFNFLFHGGNKLPYFSVTWSLKNHSNKLIYCSRNISYYQVWKQLFEKYFANSGNGYISKFQRTTFIWNRNVYNIDNIINVSLPLLIIFHLCSIKINVLKKMNDNKKLYFKCHKCFLYDGLLKHKLQEAVACTGLW